MTPLQVLSEHAGGLRSDAIGRIGEHLAAAYLETVGIRSDLVHNRPGVDLHCTLPGGSVVQMEVKCCYQPEVRDDRNVKCYRFQFTKRTADYAALVALDRSLILFTSMEAIAGQTMRMSVKEDQFTVDNMLAGLQRMVDHRDKPAGPIYDPVAIRK